MAARILRRGGLVAFPTETVYGLGADARNEPAVRRIFSAKGRPADHPLIVHIAGVGKLDQWAAAVPEAARKLAAAYWPGPLTLILRKRADVPAVVTGGQETVGLRVPAHELARAMLAEFGGGVAAPSANRFGRVSPTSAAHVQFDLGTEVDYILDGGPCPLGLESTIVDLSRREPVLLRPGAVCVEALEQLLGPLATADAGPVRAPGTLAQHYAPRAQVILCAAADLDRAAASHAAKGRRVFVLSSLAPARLPGAAEWRCLPEDAGAAAHDLYALLRAMDAEGAEVILACPPDPVGIGAAVADRLRRAAGLGSLPEAP